MSAPTHILAFRPLRKNSLRGFASVRFSSGMEMHEISIHVSGEKAWAAPPARQWIRNNEVVFDLATGKAKWEQLVSFMNHGTRASWSKQIVQALREQYPEALAGEADVETPMI